MLSFRALTQYAFTIFVAGRAFTLIVLPKAVEVPAFLAGLTFVLSLPSPGFDVAALCPLAAPLVEAAQATLLLGSPQGPLPPSRERQGATPGTPSPDADGQPNRGLLRLLRGPLPGPQDYEGPVEGPRLRVPRLFRGPPPKGQQPPPQPRSRLA